MDIVQYTYSLCESLGLEKMIQHPWGEFAC